MMKVNHNNYTGSKNMRRKGHRHPSIGPEGVPESHFGNVRLSVRTPLPTVLFLSFPFFFVKRLYQNDNDATNCLDPLYRFLTFPKKERKKNLEQVTFHLFLFCFSLLFLNMTVSVLQSASQLNLKIQRNAY